MGAGRAVSSQRQLLIFLICFVLLVASLAVVASAKGATDTESAKETTNSDGTVTTVYGNIPKSVASAETYPFAVFKYKNGALDSVSGYTTMRGALNNAKDWNNTWNKIKNEDGSNAGINDTDNTYSSTVLLRRDYSIVKYTDENNTSQIVYMGCYGIGVSRLMGVIAEKFADSKGLVWPETVAPFKYYLVGIGEKGSEVAEKIYAGHEDEVFFDDRNLRPGEKFADSELMGIPYRIVVSDKTLAENKAEITARATGETKLVDLKEIFV